MKSPTWNRLKASLAFTLIELLTVIAIIAILMGLLFPAIGAVREAARKASAKNDTLNIVGAVKAYYTEYGKYPISGTAGTDAFYGSGTMPAALSGTATLAGSTAALIDVLRYNSSGSNAALSGSLNPRQVIFIDAPMVKNTSLPTSGVIPNGSTNAGRWYDPWGSEYNVLMDGNYDNTLANPYSDTPPPGGTPLTTSVISWSFGKNGALGGGAAAGSKFTSESGAAGFYFTTPSNNTTPTSGDVISWQ